MNMASRAREAAHQIELKKDSLRQNQDGTWKLTFTVSPVDMPAALLQAAPGTRYVGALVEVGDDEAPVSKAFPAPPQGQGEARPKGGRLAQRAAMLCNERGFQNWIMTRMNWSGAGEEQLPHVVASELLRQLCCGISSRAELDSNPEAAKRFRDLETAYKNP